MSCLKTVSEDKNSIQYVWWDLAIDKAGGNQAKLNTIGMKKKSSMPYFLSGFICVNLKS